MPEHQNTKEMAASSIYLHFFYTKSVFFPVANLSLLAALHTGCKQPRMNTACPWNQSIVHCTPLWTICNDRILKNITVYFLQI